MNQVTLQVLQEAFDHWRQTRPKRERIPEYLKRMTIVAMSQYQQTQVNIATKVSHSTLRKWQFDVGHNKKFETKDFHEEMPPTIPTVSDTTSFISLNPINVNKEFIKENECNSSSSDPFQNNDQEVQDHSFTQEVSIKLGDALEISLKGYSLDQTCNALLQIVKEVL